MRTDRTQIPTAQPGRPRTEFVRILGLIAFLCAPVLPAVAVEPEPAKPVSPPATAAPERPSAGAEAPGLPVPPEAPVAPEPPRKVVKSLTASPGGSYTLAADESHRGNLYLLGTKLLLAGDQDGDVYFAGQSLQVTGLVQGDITGGCGNATFGGRIEESILFGATNTVFTGTVDKDVTIGGTSIDFLDTSHIKGDLDAGGADMTFHGRVDGDATFKGGNVMIVGVVGGDCTVETNRLEFGPGARIEGDLYYKVQESLEGDLSKFVAGKIHENESPGPEKTPSHDEDKDDDDDSCLGGFAWSVFCILGSLVIGSLCIALFPATSRGSVEAIRTEPLRTAGLGFVAAIVVPFGLALSCILIVTIPFAVILLCVWALVFFLLAALPVAAWAGKWILAKLRKPDASLYLALLVGAALLTLLYQIPKLCVLIWLVVHFLGFGGITSVLWGMWQARRAARGTGTTPPAPPPPPAPEPPPGYAPQTFGTGGA